MNQSPKQRPINPTQNVRKGKSQEKEKKSDDTASEEEVAYRPTVNKNQYEETLSVDDISEEVASK